MGSWEISCVTFEPSGSIATMMNITTWAQVYFESWCHLTQSAATSRHAVQNSIMQSHIYKKPYIISVRKHC